MPAHDDVAVEDDPQEAAERREIAASSLSRHAVMHLAYVFTDTFDRQVQEHPVVEYGDDDLKAAAQRAFDALWDFYQLCGAKFIESADS